MKRSLFLLTIVLLVGGYLGNAFAITFGDVDTAQEYPQVGIILFTFNGNTVGQCSGTLIHPRAFLTAGHCIPRLQFELENNNQVWVTFEVDPHDYVTNRYDVSEALIHPDYNVFVPVLANPDIGILILSEPVNGIEPASLPPLGYLSDRKANGTLDHTLEGGTEFTIVGYGVDITWPPPEFVVDRNRRVTTSEFSALRNVYLTLQQNPALGLGGACLFDSGGPAFLQDPSGEDYLVGTNSAGDAECVSTGINYRTDTVEARSFIDAVLNGLD